MNDTRKHAARFDMESQADRDRYEEILNNPLFTIIEEHKIKLREMEYNERGQPSRSHETLVRYITYEEKVL